MIRIFSVLASANALALLLSFAFGAMSMQRGGLDNKNDLIFNVHFLCGLFAGVVTLLVHCMIFTYFLGTGRWVKEVTLAYDLPDAPLHKTTRELKRKAFPPALFAMLSVMATAFAGGGRMLQGWPYEIHLLLAIAAIGVNFWAYWVEIRSLRANDVILAGVYREVDRVRAERGLPSNDEALRFEAEQQV
jgi:hypothetical protein